MAIVGENDLKKRLKADEASKYLKMFGEYPADALEWSLAYLEEGETVSLHHTFNPKHKDTTLKDRIKDQIDWELKALNPLIKGSILSWEETINAFHVTRKPTVTYVSHDDIDEPDEIEEIDAHEETISSFETKSYVQLVDEGAKILRTANKMAASSAFVIGDILEAALKTLPVKQPKRKRQGSRVEGVAQLRGDSPALFGQDIETTIRKYAKDLKKRGIVKSNSWFHNASRVSRCFNDEERNILLDGCVALKDIVHLAGKEFEGKREFFLDIVKVNGTGGLKNFQRGMNNARKAFVDPQDRPPVAPQTRITTPAPNPPVVEPPATPPEPPPEIVDTGSDEDVVPEFKVYNEDGGVIDSNLVKHFKVLLTKLPRNIVLNSMKTAFVELGGEDEMYDFFHEDFSELKM